MEGLVPIFLEERDREDFINSLDTKFDSFSAWHDDIVKSKNTLELKLGWYIYKNWEKVTDWSGYRVTLDKTRYGEKWVTGRIRSKLLRNFNESIVPIKSIQVTYDISDGDVSIECNNDGNWAFLTYEQIIDLGLYIESKLK